LIWSGPQKLVESSDKDNHLVNWLVNIPIPLSVPDKTQVSVGFRIYDNWTGLVVQPDGKKMSKVDSGVVLAHISVDRSVVDRSGESDRHFRLVKETKWNQRIYENLSALPSAYVVSDPIFVSSPEESVELIKKLGYDPKKQTIIELPYDRRPSKRKLITGSSQVTNIERPSTSRVSVTTDTSLDAYLVLTDMMCSGWNAYIDGKKTPIYYANELFRAVRVPTGKHVVEFKFEPNTFTFGILLAAGAAIFIIIVTAFSFLSSKNSRQLN
jgi:hypothetical protein